MKVLITCPSINSRNGGIAVLISWANTLKNTFGHDVTMFSEKATDKKCDWRTLNVPIVTEFRGGYYDVVIIGSPHSIWIEDILTTEKCFLFCQMREDLFNPTDYRWVAKCMKFYRSSLPMFSISKWNIESFKEIGRIAPTYYIGNGIDFNDFPIDVKPKGKVILLESPFTNNPTKDPDMLALRLAGELKASGYRVLAYGASSIKHTTQSRVISEYHFRPSLRIINELYSQAKVFIKSTKFDARSCSPLEAMTKGTVTSRAINGGDDDLINCYNCVRTFYDYGRFKEQTLELLENEVEMKRLSDNAVEYIKSQTWESHLKRVNETITA